MSWRAHDREVQCRCAALCTRFLVWCMCRPLQSSKYEAFTQRHLAPQEQLGPVAMQVIPLVTQTSYLWLFNNNGKWSQATVTLKRGEEEENNEGAGGRRAAQDTRGNLNRDMFRRLICWSLASAASPAQLGCSADAPEHGRLCSADALEHGCLCCAASLDMPCISLSVTALIPCWASLGGV